MLNNGNGFTSVSTAPEIAPLLRRPTEAEALFLRTYGSDAAEMVRYYLVRFAIEFDRYDDLEERGGNILHPKVLSAIEQSRQDSQRNRSAMLDANFETKPDSMRHREQSILIASQIFRTIQFTPEKYIDSLA